MLAKTIPQLPVTSYEFTQLPEKTDFRAADIFLIEDSDDNWNKKKILGSTLITEIVSALVGYTIDAGNALTNIVSIIIDCSVAENHTTSIIDGGTSLGVYFDVQLTLDGGGA